ncbi:MAG: type II secretion system F family protein [Phycisphaerales bacterium]|nr:type II secretion system F family protein [Phycisphaerales bacterium]
MEFVCEALSQDGQVRAQSVEAPSVSEAADQLRRQGLLVVNVRPAEARDGAQKFAFTLLPKRRMSGGQSLVLFSRAMKMLLESGAPLVVSLEAVERQLAGNDFRKTIEKLREAVEQGASLSNAMESEPVFSPTVRSMVAAGEATATLPKCFAQISDLLEEQFRTRKLVAGAMTYPLILTGMISVVLIVILTFIVPRFKAMFDALRAPVPMSTQIMMSVSEWMVANGAILGGVSAALVGGAIFAVRRPAVRAFLSATILKLPLLGPLGTRLILARLLRIWSAMLNSHVPLLDVIQKSAEAVRGTAFAGLTADIEEALSTGRRMGAVLSGSKHVPPIVSSAIATAEENARLAEAVTFVSGWMDEDNSRSIQQLARIAEPLLLAAMGFVVGGIALSLFLPLFDMTSAVH